MCSVWCLVSVSVCGVCEGPKTKGLGILILFGGGRYWSKEYQKNSRKFKICIIMHKYAKYAFFQLPLAHCYCVVAEVI